MRSPDKYIVKMMNHEPKVSVEPFQRLNYWMNYFIVSVETKVIENFITDF